jgi:hypothetical protein
LNLSVKETKGEKSQIKVSAENGEKKNKMAAARRVCVRLIDSDSDVGTNLPAAAFDFSFWAIDFSADRSCDQL